MNSLPPDSNGTITATSLRNEADGANTSTPTSPIQAFLKGFINLWTMPGALRTLTMLGFVLFGIVAVALALSDVTQPHIATLLEVNGQTIQTTLLAVIVFTVVGGVGFAYALAGAMQLRLLPRLLIVGLVTSVLGWHLLDYLHSGSGTQDHVSAIETYGSFAQLTVLALIWVWALGISLMRFLRTRRSSGAGNIPAPSSAAPRYASLFIAALVFLAVYYGLEVMVWVLSSGRAQGTGAASDTFFVFNLLSPFSGFSFAAPLIIYWFSTDSTEWATGIASGVVRLVGRLPWLIPLLMALVGFGACILDVIRVGVSSLILPLLAAIIIATVATVAVTSGPGPRRWPARVPALALVAGAMTLFGIIDLPVDLLGGLGPFGVVSARLVTPLIGAMIVLDALLALIVGVVLAALGRLRGRGELAAMGLMVTLVALFTVSADLDQIQANLGIALLPQPKHGLAGMEVVVAVFLLGQLVWLALRRQPLATWAMALAGPFIALVGVFAVDWYGSFALAEVDAVPSSVVLLALLFLAQELWDVARSGEPITNGDSPAAPRSSRVQLYFGYVLVSAACFLYGSSLRIQATGGVVPGDLTGVDSTTALGAFFLLCPGVAILTGLTRWQRWRAQLVAEVPVSAAHARQWLIGTVGIGSALVAALIVFTVVGVIPRALPHSYVTHLPGPNCDTKGSDWTQSLDVMLVCNPADGLHVAVPGNSIGEVGFVFPGGVSSSDYRVTVHVTFASASSCGGLITRNSPAGYYEFSVCPDGEWFILKVDSHTVSSLRSGRVIGAGNYTITAVARGSRQTIAVDGVTRATVTDSLSTDGDIALYAGNVDSSPTTVIFSDFSYTPLS